MATRRDSKLSWRIASTARAWSWAASSIGGSEATATGASPSRTAHPIPRWRRRRRARRAGTGPVSAPLARRVNDSAPDAVEFGPGLTLPVGWDIVQPEYHPRHFG